MNLSDRIILINEDAIDFLKSLPENSVDYVNCDPPYNIGFDNKSWDKFDDEGAYLEWSKEWISESARVLRPGRMLSVWGTQKNDTFFRLKLDVLNHIEGLVPQNAIHWSYNWGGRTKRNFAHKFETAWCYSKGNTFYFDRTNIEIERKMKTNVRTGKPYENGTIPTTIWDGNLTTNSNEAKESRFHPTVKPQFVLQRMILAYTKPDDVVLDCFSGSGSTAIASIHTGRKFWGTELDTYYYNKSIERIENHYKTGSLVFEDT